MESLGIRSLKNREFGSMSTGEQRRFLLARALVTDPGTLLFDEPTSGLDLKASFFSTSNSSELSCDAGKQFCS